MAQRLPIGIQTFENIIREDRLYVDKTQFLYDLIQYGSKYNFLSRPRRFGKSLIISTFKAIFEGKKELFVGLHIYDKRDFVNNIHPVVRITRGDGFVRTIDDLHDSFRSCIKRNYRDHGMNETMITEKQGGRQLKELISTLYHKTGKQVVVLIDEYDKPILDHITHPAIAQSIRDELKGFYAVLKGADEYIRFVFITGVSKFSKVSLFSGLNNLEDLTLNPAFGEICGFTDDEISRYLGDYLDGVDRPHMKKRYNGFNFLGKDTVYNPFDVLLFLKNKEYKNYRFETATPTFLVQLMQQHNHYYHLPDLENTTAGEELLGSFDLENLKIETLLFQAGYLTIKEKITLGGKQKFTLCIPNLEIKTSLNTYFRSQYLKVQDSSYYFKVTDPIYEALASGDIDKLIAGFKKMFAGIAYSSIQHLCQYEGYYSSVLYTLLYAMGLDVIQEDITSQGRIDLTILMGSKIYIIELKVEQEGLIALDQINARRYADKYLGQGTIIKLGISFSLAQKNIESWGVEVIEGT